MGMYRYSLGIIFIITLLAACKTGDPLVGTWTMRIDEGSAEMELTKEHTLRFGDNNGTWRKTPEGKVLLTMESGAYTAEVRGSILNFMVDGKDVVFTKRKD